MVDIQPQSTQPISDDQELAKVLAGVTDQADSNQAAADAPVFSSSDIPTALAAPESPQESTPEVPPVDLPTPDEPAPQNDGAPIGYNPPSDASPTPPTPNPGLSNYKPALEPAAQTPSAPSPSSSAPSGDLEGIKKDALNELRPLVDKLQLEPEEKFDTYLLLLRSTDDKELIAPAYAAAQAISDETRRAQALLDVIKEIDFLTNPSK